MRNDDGVNGGTQKKKENKIEKSETKERDGHGMSCVNEFQQQQQKK